MADGTKQKQSGLKVVEIQKLVDMLEKSNLNDLELEMKGVKLRLSKGVQAPSAAPQQAPPVVMMPQSGSVLPPPSIASQPANAPPADAAAPAGGEGTAEAVSGKKTEAITSPMVGTFYRAPAPGAEPFVKIGDHVRKGQCLCIIEAMKLMNDLECEVEGKIVDILVENAQPVEFGEKLFLIEPTG